MDHLITFILLGVPSVYLVALFVMDPVEKGPFTSSVKLVKFPSFTRKVMLFDYIRRIFGAYMISEDIWYPKKNFLGEVWQCAFCLSFWMSFLFSVPGFLTISEPFWTFPIYHFTVVSTAYMLYRFYEN